MNYEGSFIDKIGRSISIRQVDDPKEPYRIRVRLPKGLDSRLREHPDYPFEITDELRGWIEQNAETGEYLRVEAGALKLNGAGPTLNLIPLSVDELRPDVRMGLYDDWEDDLGVPWAFPLSIYRRASSQ